LELVGVLLVLIAIPLSIEVLLILSIFDVNSKSLRDEEPEPLQSLGIRACFRESVLPVGDSQVHNHQAEVISEAVR
jgi:hypothetical protein